MDTIRDKEALDMDIVTSHKEIISPFIMQNHGCVCLKF